MLEDGNTKVIGSNQIVYIYLCKSKAPIGKKLMPEENETKIRSMIGWHYTKMMIPIQ
jgi:hypothetical protein